ncbi:hypothetical protein TSAR_011235 [Trichomalopsis sarcophagae]|uniref:Uncharacterized protein n=1 Tax=Trichomalopsis sarcophagae TaxID=543379 RepID=A0A232EWL3_9HYME|nr:hypothetical protein TSAR_011235 [Trichomalopsis sarcophagae]
MTRQSLGLFVSTSRRLRAKHEEQRAAAVAASRKSERDRDVLYRIRVTSRRRRLESVIKEPIDGISRAVEVETLKIGCVKCVIHISLLQYNSL